MVEMRLGTQNGVMVLRQLGDDWQLKPCGLEGHDIWSLAHRPGAPDTVYAGSYGRGLFRSSSCGASWERVGKDAGLDHVRAIAFAAYDPRIIYVGTEPANVFCSMDGGETWRNLEVRALPEAKSWSLPYSPRAGAVRAFALHPAEPRLIYGGIEQGGVLKSSDGGESWTLAKDGVHADVHSLSLHPDDPKRLFAATGGGVYCSGDGGESWRRVLGGYTRAVLVHPTRPELVLAGPAERVGQGGQILLSSDGGGSWKPAAGGLEAPMADMVEAFAAQGERVFALRSNGQILESSLGRPRWRAVPAIAAKARALAVLEPF
jgi:photosystem II stability/assembly factor-like uncharacterized protein